MCDLRYAFSLQIFNNMLKICLIIGLSACLVVGIPSPQVEEDEYEDDKVCLTSVDSKDPETECIFPFTHDNVTHYGCPTDTEDETRRWCSTKTDKNGVHIPNENAWGYCTPGCKPEIDLGTFIYINSLQQLFVF